MNSVAVELNSDASALISADNMPASTRPRRPTGNRFDTSTGNAPCGFVADGLEARSALLAQRHGDHAGEQEDEDRRELQIGREDRAAARFLEVRAR